MNLVPGATVEDRPRKLGSCAAERALQDVQHFYVHECLAAN